MQRLSASPATSGWATITLLAALGPCRRKKEVP